MAKPDLRNDILWVAWQRHRRQEVIAEQLGAPLVQWEDLDSKGHGPLKYLLGIGRTLRLLNNKRPKTLFCMNPSLVLAALAVVVRPFFGYRLVLDTHNAGLFPAEGKWGLLNSVSRWISRKADVCIVTNGELAHYVSRNGGRPHVLPDRVPTFDHPTMAQENGPCRVLFICTFAEDEPYDQLLAAASQLSSSEFKVQVTGNYHKAGFQPQDWPETIEFLGFVPEDEYIARLAAADIVIDLTERENCLVCGAYEALAFGKPMILSDTSANREYFSAGAIYTAHDPDNLRTAILEAAAQRPELAMASAQLKREFIADWEKQFDQLLQVLELAS